jgi:hypothetical protein
MFSIGIKQRLKPASPLARMCTLGIKNGVMITFFLRTEMKRAASVGYSLMI